MKKYLVVSLSLFLLSVFAVFSAFAQDVFPRVGNNCPAKYAAFGDDCMPMEGAKYAIAKVGSRCPSGFSVDGNYCYRPVKGTIKVVPKVGKQCPKGFRIDGDYCQSLK